MDIHKLKLRRLLVAVFLLSFGASANAAPPSAVTADPQVDKTHPAMES
jgi:hypothetical protein